MILPILTLHYCSTHHLLLLPSLQEWLSFTPAQLEHTFGEVLRLHRQRLPPLSSGDAGELGLRTTQRLWLLGL
jgi:hypothetical protein